MTKLLKHTLKGWKTSLFGTLIILASLGYVYYIGAEADKWIFFGSLLIGIALIFLPDTLFEGLGKLINKNAEKDL